MIYSAKPNPDINLGIEVDGRLSVAQGHDIAKALEQNIKKEIPNIYDILVHVEPLGNEENEQFGLRPEDFECNIYLKSPRVKVLSFQGSTGLSCL